MTNFEYIKAQVGRFGIQSAQLEAILMENCLNPADEVDIHKVRLALYESAPMLINGISGISENGISFQWDKDGLRQWYSMLAAQLGREDLLAVNKIIDRTNEW